MISFSFLSTEYFDLPLDSIRSSIPWITEFEGKDLADLSIIFCSDDELLSMNQKHLNHDYYTDIITFDYSTDSYISGDLFISVDRVSDNAEIEGVSFMEEIHRVVFHGVLHLLGYNDKEDQDILVMREKENFYLAKLFHVKHT
ncbi:MAG: rRNA maturation RNase YbeY [Bacteroidota bacterium]